MAIKKSAKKVKTVSKKRGSGIWIKSVRGKLSQDDFSDKTKICQATISRLEAGTCELSLETCYKLIKHANVTPKRIFNEYAKIFS